MAVSRTFFSSALLAGLAACSSSASPGASSKQPPLSNATELACPIPGALPFQLESFGFQDSANADVSNGAFSKDEASDTLGNAGGTSANVYLEASGAPSPGLAPFHGRKAKGTSGINATPLPGENVSLWFYDVQAAHWNALGRATTDTNGYYDIPATLAPPNGSPVYAVLEADGSCAKHFDELLPSGSNVVVTDIDGTLTTDDGQLLTEVVGNDTYVPAMMKGADAMLQEWAKKKYPVVYLSARPHVFRVETRAWLESQGFPGGIVITASSTLTGTAAAPYKTAWLTRMVSTFGWKVVAAYGNADTDIQAYQAANVPNDRIFIVGPNAGHSGSTGIAGNDFSSHTATFVDAQPDNP